MAAAWALFFGGWFVLGSLGRSTTPLWFAGLGPVGVWLAAAGCADALTGARGPSRRAVAFAGPLALGGLAIGTFLHSGPAVVVAAAGWGVLSCATSRRAGTSAPLPGCLTLAHPLAGPADWPAVGARWAMLPMMAALAVQSDWCAGMGISWAQGIALHLAMMAAPALLVFAKPWRRAMRSPLWIAVFMGAGLAAPGLFPGVRGWMVMSLLHGAAWGFAWSQGVMGDGTSAPPRGGRAQSSAWWAIGPAAGLLVVGAAIDGFGFDGLIGVHVALGVATLAGTVAWVVAETVPRAPLEHEETPS